MPEPGFSLPVFDRSRPPRRPRSWPPGSRRTRDPATSSPTCSVAAAGWPAPPSTGSAGRSRSNRPRSPGCSPRSSCGRPTSATSTRRSRAWPPRRGGKSSLKVSHRRPVRDALRDVRPDARRRRVHLVGRRRGGDRRAGPAGHRATTAARSAATSAAGRSMRQAPLDADDLRRATRRRRCRRGRAPTLRATLPGRRPEPRTSSTSCSTCTRRASSSVWARSSSASRATCAPRPSWPRCVSRSSTRSCRRAAWRRHPGATGGAARLGRPRPAAERHALRERNPWLAFEDGFRLVRGFVQRLEGGASARSRPGSARTCAASGEGTATAVDRRSAGPGGLRRRCATSPNAYGRTAADAAVRLVLGQPPMRPSLDRLGVAYHGDGMGARSRGGVAAAARRARRWLPAGAVELAGGRHRPRARGRRAGDGPRRPGRPARRRRGRRRSSRPCSAGRPPATGSSALGSPTPTTRPPAIVELMPPGAAAARRPDRANVGARAGARWGRRPGHRPRDRDCSARPERFDERPFSATDAARTVTEVAVETLRARGEPARFERLLGEILVGLDRAGQLRRLATAAPRRAADRLAASRTAAVRLAPTEPERADEPDRRPTPRPSTSADRPAPRDRRRPPTETPADPVDACSR